MNSFQCRFCPASYKYLRDMKTHEKKKHGVRKKFQCSECNAESNYKSNIRYHERTKHNKIIKTERSKGSGKERNNAKVTLVKCHLCTTCIRKTKLVEHYKSEHSLEVEFEERDFLTHEDFKLWKVEEEHQNQSKFVKSTSTMSYKRSGDGENVSYEYFSCCHSGSYTSRSKGLRKPKAQGSKKIGMICPAEMKVVIYSNGTCKVKYVKTHVGHSDNLESLQLLTMNNICSTVKPPEQNLSDLSGFPLQNSLEIRDNSVIVIVEPYQENAIILDNSSISLQQKREEIKDQFLMLLNSANSIEELMFIEGECLRMQSQLSAVTFREEDILL